jgi:o-succinylbenzoate---CoA ligase
MKCPVARWAEEKPDNIALRTPGGATSYGVWHESISGLEAALAAQGVKTGGRVGLLLEASVDSATLLIALSRVGAVACPVNPAFPDAYRTARLAQLDCHHVIVDAEGDAAADSKTIPLAALRADTVFPTRATGGELNPDGPAAIIFTSGSTGTPKAAVLSYGNLSHNATLSNKNLSLESGDSWLLSLPFHHVAGLGILFRCIHAGAAIGIPASRESLENSATRLGVTHYSLVARQLARMIESPEGSASLTRAKAILLGGSAVPSPLLANAHGRGLPLFTSYGMTEMATQIATTPRGADLETLHSSGRPLGPDSIRINDSGAIEVNGPTRFLGYWDEGEIRSPFDAEGWFSTGDLGHFDDDGNLHVTGRADSMFVAGGENIQPESVERALCEIEGITQALVVPIPHPEFGATPVAFVDDRADRTIAQLREYLRGTLPTYQIPRHLLPWPSALAGEGMKINRSEFIREAERRLS